MEPRFATAQSGALLRKRYQEEMNVYAQVIEGDLGNCRFDVAGICHSGRSAIGVDQPGPLGRKLGGFSCFS